MAHTCCSRISVTSATTNISSCPYHQHLRRRIGRGLEGRRADSRVRRRGAVALPREGGGEDQE